MLKFLIYALRWQLSTPILWIVLRQLGAGLEATIIANLVGACIFFWVDQFIFGKRIQEWEFLKFGACDGCGKFNHGLRRLRYDPRGYDRRKDDNPKFLCKSCSDIKLSKIEKAL